MTIFLHHVSYYGESLCRRAYKQVLLVSTLDITTNPESVELLIPNEILTQPPMFDPPLLPTNDIDTHIVLSEPESKIDSPPLPPADELADIVSSPPLLTNDSPPTTVDVPLLLSDDDSDTKINNYLSSSNDTPTLIKTDPPVTLSPEPMSAINILQH